MKKIVAIACLLLGAPSAPADPVWVPPKGTFRFATSTTFSLWDQYLQQGSRAVDLPGEIQQYEFTVFSEYVPIENLSIDLSTSLVDSQRKFVYVDTYEGQIIGVRTGPDDEIRDVDDNFGLGDTSLGLKYVFWEKGISLGVRPWVKFPGTYEYGYLPNAPGDGQVDLGLAFLTGVHLPPIRTYLRGSFALLQRFSDPQNQMELLLEAGATLLRPLGARILYHYVNQFGGEEVDYYARNTWFPSVEEDSHRIGAGLSFHAAEKLTVFATYQQTLAGRNTANNKAFTLGLDFSF